MAKGQKITVVAQRGCPWCKGEGIVHDYSVDVHDLCDCLFDQLPEDQDEWDVEDVEVLPAWHDDPPDDRDPDDPVYAEPYDDEPLPHTWRDVWDMILDDEPIPDGEWY